MQHFPKWTTTACFVLKPLDIQPGFVFDHIDGLISGLMGVVNWSLGFSVNGVGKVMDEVCGGKWHFPSCSGWCDGAEVREFRKGEVEK